MEADGPTLFIGIKRRWEMAVKKKQGKKKQGKKKVKASNLYPSQNRTSGSSSRAPGESGGSGDSFWDRMEGSGRSTNIWEPGKRAQNRKTAAATVNAASKRAKSRKTSKTSTRSKK